MKTAIVCEGGGMRGIFTSGVLQTFMEAGFQADALYGVSAGASNGANYISGQRGRGYRTNVDYVNDSRYFGLKSLIKTGSLFGMDFIFSEIAQTLDPFDFDAFYASPCEYYVGATNVETGKVEFFGKEKLDKNLTTVRASCALPMLSPMVTFEGKAYLDGGTSCPIPFEQAIADGYERIIVILTQHHGYRKKPQGMRAAYQNTYKDYPNFVRTMALRHLVYNHQLQKLQRLQDTGRVLLIAPPTPLEISRFALNYDKLVGAYRMGKLCGFEALQKLEG